MPSRLALAAKQAQGNLKTNTATAVGTAWRNLPGYERSDLKRFVEVVTPLVQGGQRRGVANAVAHASKQIGKAPAKIDPEQIVLRTRGSVTPEEVYQRPFLRTWRLLKEGVPYEDAVARGQAYAEAAAANDVALAIRDTYAELTRTEPAIWGYQRVPSASACSYCQIASTQRFYRGDLEPLHTWCRCGVEILESFGDPTAKYGPTVINDPLYQQLGREGITNDLTSQRAASRYLKRAEQNRARAAEWRRKAIREPNPTRKARLEERAKNWEARAVQQEFDAIQAKAARLERIGKRAEVRQHDELGPVLVDGKHNFALPNSGIQRISSEKFDPRLQAGRSQIDVPRPVTSTELRGNAIPDEVVDGSKAAAERQQAVQLAGEKLDDALSVSVKPKSLVFEELEPGVGGVMSRNGEKLTITTSETIPPGALTSVYQHEFGHFIDFLKVAGADSYEISKARKELLKVIRRTDSVKEMRAIAKGLTGGNASLLKYLLSENELIARAFQRWVADQSPASKKSFQELWDLYPEGEINSKLKKAQAFEGDDFGEIDKALRKWLKLKGFL